MILGSVNYDPDEEDGRKRRSHVTKKEVIIVITFLVLGSIFLVPIYTHLMDIRNSHVCTQNLLDIGTAIEGYAADNDDRFPPVYMTAQDEVGPKVFEHNSVKSWASVISQYMKNRNSFKCPAANDSEGVLTQPGDNGSVFTTDYGMYSAFSTVARGSIPQISRSALIADTDNEGANGTADPLPLKDSKGNVTPDGMVIGLDDTNLTEDDRTEAAIDAAKYATRLAAPQSVKMGFDDHTYTRHPDGINVLMADLHREHIHGPDLLVEHPGRKGAGAAGITGYWYVPPAP